MSDSPSQPAQMTADEVRHVAKLARLRPDAAAVADYGQKLPAILDYVAKIGQVDVAGVEPTAHAADLVEVVLQNAPDADPPFFKVPKVLGGDEDSAG